MEEAPFIVTIIAITMGTFLVTMRMIMGHLKWRVQQRHKGQEGLEGSVRLAELEELVRQAAIEANEPLMRRLESMDLQMRHLSAAPDSGGHQTEEETPSKSIGRLSSGTRG